MVNVFASGGMPDECPDGHEWGPGRVIVGWVSCLCANAVENNNGHHFIHCAPPGGRCSRVWRDPPCADLQRGEPPAAPGG